MKHPLYTSNHGTEVTVSSVHQGRILVCTEKFDQGRDRFLTAVISLPDGDIVSTDGYPEEELQRMKNLYMSISDEIIGYVLLKERICARLAGNGENPQLDETEWLRWRTVKGSVSLEAAAEKYQISPKDF